MGQTTEEAVLLSGRFSLLGSRKEHDVILSGTWIRYAPVGQISSKSKVILLDDVIGAHCMKGNSTADHRAYLTLYVYARGKTLTGGVNPVRSRSVVVFGVGTSLVFTENLQMANVWRQAVREVMRPLCKIRFVVVPFRVDGLSIDWLICRLSTLNWIDRLIDWLIGKF